MITPLIVLFMCFFVFFLDESKVKKKQTPSSANVMRLVSTNRQGVSRQVKRLQGRLGPGKSKATVKDKRITSAVGQWAQFTAQQHSEECIWIKMLCVSSKMSELHKDRKQAFSFT